MDRKIQEAIETAVRDAGQNEGLARKLSRWFKAISTGSEDVNDSQSANRHLELLYSEIQLEDIDDPVDGHFGTSASEQEGR